MTMDFYILPPLVLGTIHLKVGEKESIFSQSMQDKEISPSG